MGGFSSKLSLFWENGRVDPYLYIREIFSIQIRDREARKPTEGEFDRILRILKNCGFLDDTLTYYQTFKKLTSKLGPISESGGSKMCEGGMKGFATQIF